MPDARGVVFAVALAASTASAQAAPTGAALADAVHRLVRADADADACAAPTSEHGELRYECTTRECPGACQVVHVITTLAFRGGRFRRVSQRREPRGDTGECGCCL